MNFTEDLLAFLAESPTAVHAAGAAADRLATAGFIEVDEADAWHLQPGDAFFVRRGNSGLVAGIVGRSAPAQTGFRLVGAHTDAPALRLKPCAHYVKEGFRQLAVEVYGGPILATWTDRDLTLAGHLVAGKDGKPWRTLPVRLDKPVCRIPNLAIHFNREVNDKGLKLDKQKHLPPIYGLADGPKETDTALLKALAKAAGVPAKEIRTYCLDLVDAQPPALGGLADELLFARGIDNLVSSHAAVLALIEHRPAGGDPTALIALFDNEEVGSNTYRGAGSTLLDCVMERLCLSDENPRESLLRAAARSLMVSADGAHAVHPNYAELHEPLHKPLLGGGPVIKVNAGERYATTAATRAYLLKCAKTGKIPMQDYVQRSDLTAGTTIGPISATRLGVPTVDVGAPMLSMHSIRETTTPRDCELLKDLLAIHLGARIALIN